MDPVEIRQHVTGLTQRVEALTTQVQDLKLKNQNLRLYITQNLPRGGHHEAPEPKVNPPDIFSGDRRKYREFINSCQLLFDLNARTYPTDRVRVCTLISYLRGEPRSWANTYLEQEDPILDSLPKFIAAMSLLYEDTNKQLTAELALRNLKQGKRPVEDYIAEFQCWALDSEWNQVSLRNQFRLGLSEPLKDDLARIELPSTLEQLIQTSIAIDRRLRERRAERTRSVPTYPRRTITPPVHNEPMEIGTIKGPLSQAERIRRKTLNLCMYCGSADHSLDSCHLLRKKEDGKSIVVTTLGLTKPSVTNYLKLSLSLQWDQRRVEEDAMLDSGACGNFMDTRFVELNKIPTISKSSPVWVRFIDGTTISSGPIISHTIPLKVTSNGDHVEFITFDVIPSPMFPIILGLPWLRLHNPSISWQTSSIEYSSEYCSETCKPFPTILQLSVSGLPPHYQDFTDVFDTKMAEVLPPHRPYDCPIDLVPGSSIPFGRVYPLSHPELQHLKEYLDENLRRGFIRPSTSPAGAGMFFVKNKDASLRPIIDYRELNKITVKNRYPLPLIPELLERLQTAKVFTKLDLKGAYNLIRIRSGDEWKTAFRTRYGLYEYLVMPFGLCNAPATFQHFINDVFRDLLDVCVVIYLDNILIYSDSLTDHRKHVQWVLARLRTHNLYAKPEKCIFETTTISFLGYSISPLGVKMEQTKVDCVVNWPTPRNRKAVQRFLGFSNFYRKFIKNFSAIVKPLTKLTSINTRFNWNTETQQAFDELKKRFTAAPILQLPNPDWQYIVEVDASQIALGAILSQRETPLTPLHPVAFYSRTLNEAERNYPVGEKELLAIKAALETWRHLLEGSKQPFVIYSDHQNLQYLQRNKTLSSRQVRWSFFFDRFDFIITYRPGSKNGKADSLSRMHDLPEPTPVNQPIIPHERILSSIVDLKQELKKAQLSDINPKPPNVHPDHEGIYCKGEKMYVPASFQVHILRLLHDTPLAGHPGVTRTLNLVCRYFWWPKMSQTIFDYVTSCQICATSKHETRAPYGLLTNLPIPERPWEVISLDFIVELPPSKNFNTIMVVVDHLTKMAHFTPLTKLPSAVETADALLSNVIKLHGYPNRIISDRGSQFISKFWKALCKNLGIDHRMSSAYHPQTNGLTERVNQCLEQYIRCSCSHLQDDWADLLGFAEFSYNNSLSSSTQVTPFYANYGFHPSPFPPILNPSNIPTTESYVETLKKTLTILKDNLRKAQERQKLYYDLKRRPPPVYNVGDQVWLSTRNLRTTTPTRKFAKLFIGPFSIQSIINPSAVRLDLPPDLRIHPVFHVALLKPFKREMFPDRTPPPLPPITVQNQEEYEVEKILDSRKFRNRLQYLIRWKSYGPQDDSWEDSTDVHAPRLLKAFHLRYPEKPKTLGALSVGALRRGYCHASGRDDDSVHPRPPDSSHGPIGALHVTRPWDGSDEAGAKAGRFKPPSVSVYSDAGCSNHAVLAGAKEPLHRSPLRLPTTASYLPRIPNLPGNKPAICQEPPCSSVPARTSHLLGTSNRA